MTPAELREEIAVELENLELTVAELRSLRLDVTGREPTVREKTAAASFLAQFYGGAENILKRISRFHSVPLPVGDDWHIRTVPVFLFTAPRAVASVVRCGLGGGPRAVPEVPARGPSQLRFATGLGADARGTGPG